MCHTKDELRHSIFAKFCNSKIVCHSNEAHHYNEVRHCEIVRHCERSEAIPEYKECLPKQGSLLACGLLRRFTPRNDEGNLPFAMTGGARLLAMTGLVLLFVHDGIDA